VTETATAKAAASQQTAAMAAMAGGRSAAPAPSASMAKGWAATARTRMPGFRVVNGTPPTAGAAATVNGATDGHGGRHW